MNYDAEKAIAELETAITMIRFGMYGTAKENIGHAVCCLAKAGSPPTSKVVLISDQLVTYPK